MPNNGDDKPFKVQDRRRFTETGEVRQESAPEQGGPKEPDGPAPHGAAAAADDALRGGPKGPAPDAGSASGPGSASGSGAGAGAGAPTSGATGTAAGTPGAATTQARPPIDFTTFVFSLGSSALMLLGEAPNPETGESMKNLPLAKETIDLLSMLQDKTKGNLTQEEQRFLDSLLYDLRLRFVEASKS